MGSTIEELLRADTEVAVGRRVVRRRRWLYRVVMAVLVVLLGSTVLDGLDVVDTVGPDEVTERHVVGDVELEVEYPSVSRPGLASVLRITVRRPRGLDTPIEIGVDRAYLERWDVNAVLPAPSSETSAGPWVVWEYDAPADGELTVSYEARLEPSLQEPFSGAVAVFEADGQRMAYIGWRTRVMP